MICEQCGEEHSVDDMELSFRRPDEIADLSEEERASRLQENMDLCILDGERFFIRGVLPLPVLERQAAYNIGLWVEVDQKSFECVWELWSDPQQGEHLPFPAKIANDIPMLPATVGILGSLRLTGPKTRPNIVVYETSHPLYLEQRLGITSHRAHEYSSIYS